RFMSLSSTAWKNALRSARNLSLGVVVIGVLGACGGTPQRTTFDLTAPTDIGRVGGSRAQLVVNEPTTVQAIDSDRILVRDAGALSYLPDAQWADRLPKLFQVRLIQTFENASRLGRVGRPGDRVVADLALNVDIRSFGIEVASSQVVVEVTVRVVSDRTGRVSAARGFVARIPVSSVTGPVAAKALDEAMSQVLRDIVRWAGRS
ncbi:MAG: ABC-type transport auxiliary lipoprotein family protein, partial [Bosea sp. (in: a-proteobacteria)]